MFHRKEQLTDPDSFIKAQTTKLVAGSNEQHKAPPTEFKLKRSDSITSVNSYFFHSSSNSSSSNSLSSALGQSKKQAKGTVKEINFDLIYLRLCFDCGKLLEKKYKSFKDRMVQPEFANLYDVICKLFS